MYLRWRPLMDVPQGAMSPELRAWLAERHSLTRRLRRHCHGGIKVRVLRHGVFRPHRDEACVLGLRGGALALVREVILFCGPNARVYARSVIPLATLTGGRRRLRSLGSRPLGDLLFADPAVERRVIEVTELQPGTPMSARATQLSAPATETIWGRRSVFHLQGKPLLVSEFFLPGLCLQPMRTNIPANR